jgi:hypothetical protein
MRRYGRFWVNQEASRGMDQKKAEMSMHKVVAKLGLRKTHTCVGDTTPDRQLCPAAQRTELAERPAVGHAKPGAHGVGDDEPAGQ